jgi:hypothetical protein
MEIAKFRSFIIHNHDVLKQYLDISNRSLIPIQSSLDWFETSCNFFREYTIDKDAKADVYTFLCYAKLSAIDNIVESIITLKKTLRIEKMKTKKEYVFLKDLDIFVSNVLNDSSDYTHFKNLRAIFGAHTVDIKLLINGIKVPYFAQWSTRLSSDADISVFIHSPEVGMRDIQIDLYFDKLSKIITKAENELDEIVKFLSEEVSLKGLLDLSSLDNTDFVPFQIMRLD